MLFLRVLVWPLSNSSSPRRRHSESKQMYFHMIFGSALYRQVWGDVMEVACLGDSADAWVSNALGSPLRLVAVLPGDAHSRPIDKRSPCGPC
jgi:hypothetical protein